MKKFVGIFFLSLGALWSVGPATAVTVSDRLCWSEGCVSLSEGTEGPANQAYIAINLGIGLSAVGLTDNQGLSDIVYYTPDGNTPLGPAPFGPGLYMISDTETALALALDIPTIPETGTLQDLSSYFGGAPVSALSDVETPLPAALPLFATGLGALGVLGFRRKRKAAAALAA